MRPRERQLQITDLVRSRNRVSVDELAMHFNASAETIRRDLTFLAGAGKIQKIHGGAVPLRHFGEGPFAQRMELNQQAKRLVARNARALVSSGSTLFIDTGSTTLVFADELAGIDSLTVVTNSAEIAKTISSANPGAQLFLLGGSYNGDNRQTCGAMAIEQLGNFHADLALLAVAGVGADGAMDYSPDEARIAAAMLRRAERVSVLADSSKFERNAPFVVSGWDGIDALVCEQSPQGELRDKLLEAGVEIIC